jgi:hypothetical protein
LGVENSQQFFQFNSCIRRVEYRIHGFTKFNKHCLTQRAADKWDSAQFLAVFNASAASGSQAGSVSRPLAGNANRWAAGIGKQESYHLKTLPDNTLSFTALNEEKSYG